MILIFNLTHLHCTDFATRESPVASFGRPDQTHHQRDHGQDLL
jgi:hypothetical protein